MMTAKVTANSAAARDPVSAATSGVLDLSALRLPQDFAANLGVKKLLVQVPVCKPRKGWFVRTRKGEEWRTSVAMIVLKEEGESYVVHPKLAADLPDDAARGLGPACVRSSEY